MTPVVVQPDVELWATQWLREALAGRPEAYASDVVVATAVPTTRRPRMVVVRHDGGLRLDLVRELARLSVNVWGGTEQEATDLARLVSALLWSAPTGDPVLRITQPSGAAAVPDPSGQPLRYLVFEVTTRGQQLT